MNFSFNFLDNAKDVLFMDLCDTFINMANRKRANEVTNIIQYFCSKNNKNKYIYSSELRKFIYDFIDILPNDLIFHSFEDYAQQKLKIKIEEEQIFPLLMYCKETQKVEYTNGPIIDISPKLKYLQNLPNNEEIYTLWKEKRKKNQEFIITAFIALQRNGLNNDIIQLCIKKSR